MQKIVHTLFILLALIPALSAQERLVPLSGNFRLMYHDLKDSPAPNIHNAREKSALISIQLPFKDDFHYAGTTVYPDPALWSDSQVYVNAGFGIAPPSLGVATFDGLDRVGYPINPQLTTLNKSEPADTLTSQPINLYLVTASSKTLQPSDSLALLFYYQARGLGDNPEASDVLSLDFYKPAQNKWENGVWTKSNSTSSNTLDSVFYRAIVRIDDTAYFHDGFRFRFRNSATTSGNYDHWHIDYIYLDEQIFNASRVFDDLTFSHIPTSFLKDYSAMPWQQYNASEMAEKISVRIRNNSSQVLTMSYNHDVYDAFTKQLLHSYNGGAENLATFESAGYSNKPSHSNPPITANYTFADLSASRDLMIKHYVFRAGTSDFIKGNDTLIQFQRFRNYYAFDDESAEAGYYINGSGGRVAVKTRINVADSLRGLQVYFDPAANVTAAYNFTIYVWGEGNSGSFTELYQSPQMAVQYQKGGYKPVPEYILPEPVFLPPGTYYIGIRQGAAAGIPVGFDMNYNFGRNTYYNEGLGWKQSTLNGALMMRPVFGYYVAPVGLADEEANPGLNVFPNPATGEFTISCGKAGFSYRLMNATGQQVLDGETGDSGVRVSTDNLPAGIYFLQLNQAGRSTFKKLIIQH